MTGTPGHDWKYLAEAACDEPDPKKLMKLIDQLNHALAEHMKDFYPCPEEPTN